VVKFWNQAAKAAVVAAVLGAGAVHPAAAETNIGWIELEGSLREQPDPFGWLSGGGATTLRDAIASLDAAAERRDLDALVVRLREPALTTTQVEELGAAITRVRDAGKPVHLFTEIYGPSEVVLGAFADEVILQKGGAVSLPGLYAEEMYLADTLEWLGLEADFVQVGKYKGAEEPLANSEPSEAWEWNISQLLDTLYGQLREHVRRGRGLSDAELDKAMQAAWMADGPTARRVGLIDTVIDRLELSNHLADAYDDEDVQFDTSISPQERQMQLDTMSNPFAFFQMLTRRPDHRPTRDTIAILHINGAIVDGESKPAGITGGASVGSLTIRKALKKIEDEPLIKGVVVRIESPGGSAIASESIWLGLRRVAERKPVWVSVGGMAASGGYYIAVAGERIYLNPSSIVGSVGVVGGKIVMGDLYERVELNVVPRARGPRAAMFSTKTPWSESERAFVRKRMKETYELFVKRVRIGRPGIDIGNTAAGRLFAGEKAVSMEMADEIGGVDAAIVDLAGQLGLAEGKYDVMSYPGPKSLDEMLEQLLGGFGAVRSPGGGGLAALIAGAVESLAEVAGPRAWPSLRDSLDAMLLLREEPVLLTMPRTLIFR